MAPVSPFSMPAELKVWPIFLWTHARGQVQFAHLAATPPFDDLAKRQEVRSRLMMIDGLYLPDEYDKYPGFPLTILKTERAVDDLVNVWNWIASELKEFQPISEV